MWLTLTKEFYVAKFLLSIQLSDVGSRVHLAVQTINVPFLAISLSYVKKHAKRIPPHVDSAYD